MPSQICFERITSSKPFSKGMFSKRDNYGWLRKTAGFWKQYLKLCDELDSLVEVPIVISDLSCKCQRYGKITHWHWFLSLEQKALYNRQVSPNVVLTTEKIPRSIYINFSNSIQNICVDCGGHKSRKEFENCQDCMFLNQLEQIRLAEEYRVKLLGR